MAKTIKHYDFSKKPLRPSKFWMWLARNFAIRPRLKGRKVTVAKKKAALSAFCHSREHAGFSRDVYRCCAV